MYPSLEASFLPPHDETSWELIKKYRDFLRRNVFLTDSPEERTPTEEEIELFQLCHSAEKQKPGQHIDNRNIAQIMDFHRFDKMIHFLGFLSGKKILDIGAGKSSFGAAVEQKRPGTQVFVMDNDTAVLNDSPSDSNRKILADATDLRQPDNSYDAVIATYSLPFWAARPEDGAVSLRENLRVVRPDGHILVSPIVEGLMQKSFGVERALDRQVALHPSTLCILYSDMLVIDQLEEWQETGAARVDITSLPFDNNDFGLIAQKQAA